MKTDKKSGKKTAEIPAGRSRRKGPVLPAPEQEPGEPGTGSKNTADVSRETGTATGLVAQSYPGDHPVQGMEGRAFWSGAISIGLVNVPVRLHTMVRDKSFQFRLLHRADGQPLRYDRVCTREGKVVPWAETVRGYEVRKGEFLVFSSEELRAVMPESDRKIRLSKFVHYLSLDPMYFGTSYLLIPDKSEDAYSLLLSVIRDDSKAGVGTITLRTKEHPVVVHAYAGGLVLTTLHYPDEVTQPTSYSGIRELKSPKEAELALAQRIVNELSGDFSIAEFHDRYREAIDGLIEKKLAGEKLVYAEPHPEEAKELMDALKETIATLSKQ